MSVNLLIISLVEHVGLMVATAFILLTMAPVRELGFNRSSLPNRIFLTVFFGIFGILGTYGGNAIFDSIANLRAMAVITAGLYAGPVVGLGAGLIAGGHRILIDPWGFSTVACTLATILEGLCAGLISRRLGENRVDWRHAVFIGVVGEGIHMLLVLALSRPFADAVALVKVIAVPMILANPLGAAITIQLIRILFEEREKRESIQAQKIFAIASETVSHLRGGLSMDSAKATARIIFDRLPVAAVAITDTATVLAHVGEGADHHLAGKGIRTAATRMVLENGKPIFHRRQGQIGCNHPVCTFGSAIIVPLKKGGDIVGTLKFYGTGEEPLDRIKFEIAKGLADLLSIQLELEDIQLKGQLLAHAEIRHLQAQINPHFLFNSLNTIASFCRTDSARARDLILDLSRYMRKNLDSSRGFIPLSSELEQINAYLAIEKARFGSRINVTREIEPGCEEWPIPSLIIQPIVENAIKHGIACREEGGTVTLRICRDREELSVSVADDGAGMDRGRIDAFFRKDGMELQSEGIGLRNCNHRLEQIYGPQHRMEIESAPEKGTRIAFSIPKTNAAATRGAAST